MTRIEFGQAVDIGRTREVNQDAALSIGFTAMLAERRVEGGIFAVIDGLGDKEAGLKAATITLSTLAAQLSPTISAIVSGQASDQSITDAIVSAMQMANAIIADQVLNCGAVATVAVVFGENVYLGHVGDTRAWLVTDGEITLLTQTHTLPSYFVAGQPPRRGTYSDEGIPWGGSSLTGEYVLYRGLGQSDSVEIDTVQTKLPPHSALLLASDGLWSFTLEVVLASTVREAPTPQHACDHLVALANEAGGTDNIAVIVIRAVGD